jgi:hypothetical protein
MAEDKLSQSFIETLRATPLAYLIKLICKEYSSMMELPVSPVPTPIAPPPPPALPAPRLRRRPAKGGKQGGWPTDPEERRREMARRMSMGKKRPTPG